MVSRCVAFVKRWWRAGAVVTGTIFVTGGVVAMLQFVSNRTVDAHFRVLNQAQLLVDGELLAFTTVESPEFADPSVGYFAIAPRMQPLKPWSTTSLSVFIDSPADADFALLASSCTKASRNEAVGIERVDINGRSILYSGGVPVGGIVFVPPDLLAVLCAPTDVAANEVPTLRFYQFLSSNVVPIGQFSPPESACIVRKVVSVGNGQILIYAQIGSDAERRCELFTYDIPKAAIVTQTASMIDSAHGLQLAADAAQTHVAVASRRQVELRRLPDLTLVSEFVRPEQADTCVAVANEGRYVALGGFGTWVWSSSNSQCRQIHPGSHEPILTLNTRGAHGDHMDHGAFLHNYMMHSRQRVKFVGFLGNTTNLVEVTGDGVAAKWNIERSQLLETHRLWK